MTKVRLNQLDAAATAALWSCASPRASSAAADSRSTPGGRAIVPSSKQQPDGTLAKALARAWRCQRMLEEDVYASVSDIGDAENISKSYVSWILRLALLAPEFVETILAGSTDQVLMLEKLQRPLAASWAEQRQMIGSF